MFNFKKFSQFFRYRHIPIVQPSGSVVVVIAVSMVMSISTFIISYFKNKQFFAYVLVLVFDIINFVELTRKFSPLLSIQKTRTQSKYYAKIKESCSRLKGNVSLLTLTMQGIYDAIMCSNIWRTLFMIFIKMENFGN